MDQPGQRPHLAQINVGRLRHGPGSPQMREFMAALGRINELAERSPGFVWRFPTDEGHFGCDGNRDDPSTFVNVSVWLSYRHLHAFTYRTTHGHLVRRRREWFVAMTPPTTALWWTPVGEQPTIEAAMARLRQLRIYGPTPQAFSLRRRFDPSGRPEPPRRTASPRMDGRAAPAPSHSESV